MQDQYDSLTREQLVALLRKHDGKKKLGLVWEREEIEADRAIDADFVACRVDPDLSDGGSPWPNLIIEGDNFDVLRWLRMTHSHAVKCIYIDPPYNTGAKDWVYNDHYIDKTDRWRQSTWLEFLYQRLSLARDLLAEDGVMLISINDEQRAKLEMLCDDVLPGMRLGSFAWRTKDTGDVDRRFSQVHEHILVFANKEFKFEGSPVSASKFRNPDNDPRGPWSSQPLTKSADLARRAKTYYPIMDPETELWYPCDPLRVWAYASESNIKLGARLRASTMEHMIRERRIYFPQCKPEDVFYFETKDELISAVRAGKGPKLPKKGTQLLREDIPDLDFWVGKRIAPGRPSRKDFLTDKPLGERTAPVSSWISGLNESADYDVFEEDEIVAMRSPRMGVGGDDLVEVFGSKPFDFPKPVSLIRELVRQSTSPGDLILDFFAGSATTAHAVMELNAEDGGERRFIMVSSTEATTDFPDRNICRDVTAERVRRLSAAKEGKHADLSAPFAYLHTRQVAFEDLDYDLQPEEVWAALEALHRFPLTRYDPALGWQEHERDGAVLVFAERCDRHLAERLSDLIALRLPLTVYAWTPGQVAALASGVEVLPVRQTLTKFFGQ